ncbi:peptidoglycan editing factor PgeF [Corynebacterium sp. H113]|uniref:peptidoglycan editing factor PgeF n=1 Tax=Corynebacterium sp. H113 TaxID=3133419 RepID=UPI0030A3ED23
MTSHSDDRRHRKIFTTRHGGYSTAPFDSFNLGDHVGDDPENVAKNRRRLAEGLGIAPENFVYMEQVHSNNVTVIDGPVNEPVETTDALITATPGLALVVLVADCVPVLLSDDDAGIVAAVHAGRMGARNGVVRKTVEKMIELGSKPANIHCLLGPAASGAHYEVPESMAIDVENRLPGSRTRTKKGSHGIDVRAGIIHQLVGIGVSNINADPRCTIDDHSFFSYRREGKTGRQAGVIVLTS